MEKTASSLSTPELSLGLARLTESYLASLMTSKPDGKNIVHKAQCLTESILKFSKHGTTSSLSVIRRRHEWKMLKKPSSSLLVGRITIVVTLQNSSITLCIAISGRENINLVQEQRTVLRFLLAVGQTLLLKRWRNPHCFRSSMALSENLEQGKPEVEAILPQY